MSHEREEEVGGEGAQIAEEAESGSGDFDGGFPGDAGEFGGQMDRKSDQIQRCEDRRQVVSSMAEIVRVIVYKLYDPLDL